MSEPNEQNPYETPSDPPADRRVPHQESVEFEPHMQQDAIHPVDESERAAGYALAASVPAETDAVDHSVWDEPGRTVAVPAEALTYSRWLEKRIAATSLERSWLVTFAVAACAGLLAVVGAVVTGSSGAAQGIILVCIIGPITEEIMKVAIAIWIVEKRPYLFKSELQIAVCAAAGGLLFAVVENLLYLNVYIPKAAYAVAYWRWTVCVALHVGCSLVAGMGLIRIWADCMEHRHRPQLSLGSQSMIVAILVHAVYNCCAVVLSLSNM